MWENAIFRQKRAKLFAQIKNFAYLCPPKSPDGGIGRRAGLKHQWGNPSRFDPGSGYKAEEQKCYSAFTFYEDLVYRQGIQKVG